MSEWSEAEACALVELQRGIPLCARPFAEVGARTGLSEEAVLALIGRLRERGDMRRFGAVFDARRLGYRSALCAVRVPTERLAQTAAAVAEAPGVTHAYERGWPEALPADSPGGPAGRCWPNLWFTLAAPAETFASEMERLRAACLPDSLLELPAVRRFKIDVVFDVRTRERDERVEPRPPRPVADASSVPLDTEQRAWIRRLDGDLPVCARFFEAQAAALGVREETLLARLSTWQETGVIRRIGLLLRHRELGFRANGMCCWETAPEEVREKGRLLAAAPEVTHCYERPPAAAFPFRLYAMIHTRSWQETQRLFERLAAETALPGGQLLLSLTEFKKTSMQFFH